MRRSVRARPSRHARLCVHTHVVHVRCVRAPSAQVVGMGLLLTFIGLQSSKVVVADAETMVTMGDLLSLEPMLAILGLAIIAALHYRCAAGQVSNARGACGSERRHPRHPFCCGPPPLPSCRLAVMQQRQGQHHHRHHADSAGFLRAAALMADLVRGWRRVPGL